MSAAPAREHQTPVSRSRKSHRKSRSGCRRCKERKIKCDEKRPICSACERKGDECSLQFLATRTPLREGQIASSNVFKLILPAPESTTLFDATETALIQDGLNKNASLLDITQTSSTTFNLEDLAMLRHFEKFTSTSIGDETVQKAYANEVLEMALQYPYLMHAILALSKLHADYLMGPSSQTNLPSRFVTTHWQHCLRQFSIFLTPRIEGEKADAMLITSTIINGIAFCMLERRDNRHPWPLTSGNNDLYWLSIQKGISLVFRAVTPLNESSKIKHIFGPDTDVDSFGQPEVSAQMLILFLPELAELCGITTFTTLHNNVYHKTLCILAPLIQIPCNSQTIFAHLSFIASVDEQFISLLQAKDHRALLILCYWYANINSYDCWWTSIRSRAEGIALCRYLEKEADNRILLLLKFPAKVFGIQLARQKHSNKDEWQGEIQTPTPCHMM